MGVDAKARRLLTEGRVSVDSADPTTLVATVRGDHGTYTVRVLRPWNAVDCSCPAWLRKCSHAVAVLLVAGRTAENLGIYVATNVNKAYAEGTHVKGPSAAQTTWGTTPEEASDAQAR